MVRVIFACVHNAGRSQMAAAFFNQLADPEKAQAVSAGTHPAAQIHPGVEQVMLEVGIDLRGKAPQQLTEELARTSGRLITMGCGEQCPHVPGLHREDWPLPDPKGLPLPEVREIRDRIRRRVLELVAREKFERGPSKPSPEE